MCGDSQINVQQNIFICWRNTHGFQVNRSIRPVLAFVYKRKCGSDMNKRLKKGLPV